MESRIDTTWSIICKNLAWVNECLLELEKFTTHFSPWDLQTGSLKVMSHTFSKHLIFSLYLTYFSLYFLAHRSENTRWLFIEKTIITIYNWLNSRCNRLFWRSNQLYYHFNRLMCSSQILENFQEQCNRLDSRFNQLKCSWSLMRTLLEEK